MTEIDLNALLDNCKSGLYAIENYIDKKVYLAYGSNVAASLVRILGEIRDGSFKYKDMIEDRNKYRFVFLEEVSRENNLNRMHFWVDYYRDRGYTEYRNTKRSQLKINKRFVYTKNGIVIEVRIVNTRGKDIVVGEFDKEVDADKFISTHYNKERIVNIVYK